MTNLKERLTKDGTWVVVKQYSNTAASARGATRRHCRHLFICLCLCPDSNPRQELFMYSFSQSSMNSYAMLPEILENIEEGKKTEVELLLF